MQEGAFARTRLVKAQGRQPAVGHRCDAVLIAMPLAMGTWQLGGYEWRICTIEVLSKLCFQQASLFANTYMYFLTNASACRLRMVGRLLCEWLHVQERKVRG